MFGICQFTFLFLFWLFYIHISIIAFTRRESSARLQRTRQRSATGAKRRSALPDVAAPLRWGVIAAEPPHLSCALRACRSTNTARDCRGIRRKATLRAARCSAYAPVGLTRSLPLISPFGLPPAVSRAATLAAWVPPTHSTSVDSLAPARLGPAGLPLAASRAVSQTAWVPGWHEALARGCCSRPTPLGRGRGEAATSLMRAARGPVNEHGSGVQLLQAEAALSLPAKV